MNRSRTYFSVFLGVVLLVASYYISRTFFLAEKDDNSFASVSKIFSSGTTPKFAETLPVGGAAIGSSNVNITKTVVDDISAGFYTKVEKLDTQQKEDLFAKLKEGNTEGLSFGTVDPEQIIKKLTPDLIGIRDTISDDEIKLDLQGDTKTYEKRYLLAITDIQLFVSERDASEVLNSFINKGDSTDLDSMIGAYQNTYAALREIPVPVAAKDFHKKNLLYFSNSVATYLSIRQYQSDPLRAYIAAQNMNTLQELWGEIYSNNIL